MTNEEIIKTLELWENQTEFDEVSDDDGKWHDIHEAVFEIVEALKRDAINTGEVTTTGYADMVEYPCEDAVSRWIPVSERLPDKYGGYLCTVVAPFHEVREMIYAPIEAEWMDETTEKYYGIVTAWMPLPKAYKAESEKA